MDGSEERPEKARRSPRGYFGYLFFPIPIYRGFLSVVTPCIIIFSHSDDSNPQENRVKIV